MSEIIKKLKFGSHQLTLETGIIARQANASVIVKLDDTWVMVNVVGKQDKEDAEPRGFFPLTVNYQEKTYAAGKIPGGFFKREGRPSERETLISRLIDRPLRPLFPKGFEAEVQIIVTVLSYDPNVQSDIPALIGASAALSISGIPFNGPIAAARVGYINNEYCLNFGPKQAGDSKLDLVVAGTSNAVLMVESEAQELSEAEMLGAVEYGHKSMQPVIDLIKEFAQEVNPVIWEWKAPESNVELYKQVQQEVGEQLTNAYQVSDKMQRQELIASLKEQVDEKFLSSSEDESLKKEVRNIFSKLEKDTVRQQIIQDKPRIDGRDNKTVRKINIDIGLLPRAHGSALFTRGETQALVVTTLGTERDAQITDQLDKEEKNRFMLHYNFPPYCVGEIGFMSGPKRREIGHGKLASRALQAVLPKDESKFPYVMRVVSEITESNGSSSMATVCGGSLSMMQAGVPLKAPVAGIAMGLIKEDSEYRVLTDILGDEDHLGDMDFKVAGTKDGVTALQMDIKIDGITTEIMEVALAQAKEGRLHILDIMDKTISAPKEDVSNLAPSMLSMQVHPDKIREIIGKGGATIRSLTEGLDANIDISDEGLVTISAENNTIGKDIQARIENLIAEAEIGKVYEGKVVRLMDFGAFVNFLPGKDGLVHISQISVERVEKVADVLKEGQQVSVKVLDIDRQGRVKLSMKEVDKVKV